MPEALQLPAFLLGKKAGLLLHTFYSIVMRKQNGSFYFSALDFPFIFARPPG